MESESFQDRLGVLMCLPSYQHEENFGEWLYLGSGSNYWISEFLDWMREDKPDLVKRIEEEKPWELIEDIVEDTPFWENGELGFERDLLMEWVEFVMKDPARLSSIKDQLQEFFDDLEVEESEWKCLEVDKKTAKEWFNELKNYE